MEVGLVCIYSPVPQVRAHVEDMARLMISVENATQRSIDASRFALRARIASWRPNAVVQDPETETHLHLMGHAWQARRQINAMSLLRDFLRDGESALTQLGGSFAILIWRPHNETLLIATDRLATKKIFFWHSGDTTLLSTELRPLLAHPLAPREIDAEAVEQFLITSHPVDGRSLIKGVHLLEPGTITRIDPEGLTACQYWRPGIEPDRDDGLDRWADRLADALSPAIQARCGHSPLLLPLSGGLDSRSVAAFIPARMAAATACSFGHSHCYDVRYGRRVAKALGATFQELTIPPDFFHRYLGPVQLLCDGEVSIEALPMYRLIETGQLGQTMPMGFLGDALSGGHLVGLDPALSATDAMDAIWRTKYQAMGFSERQLEEVLLPERYQAVKGSTRAVMRAALDSAEADTLDEKALVVELYHRQSRYISYFGRLLSSRFHVEFPFLDVDVLNAFLSLPLVHRKHQCAYRRMLVRHAPRLAAVSENKTHKPVAYTDRYGLSLPPPQRESASRLPAGLQWRLNAARHKFGELVVNASGGWLGPHDRNRYVHHDENIRRVNPDWFRSRLLESPHAGKWFHLPALKRLIDEHMTSQHDHSIRINNVIAFLAWCEVIRG